MLLPLVASLALGTTLADLKLDVSRFVNPISTTIANGMEEPPVARWNLPNPMPLLTGEEKAALTREALTQARTWIESEEGRKNWAATFVNMAWAYQPVHERSASLASSAVYWSTLARERKPSDPRDAEQLAKVTVKQNAFKANRARLEREAVTRAKAMASPDQAAYVAQLKERITYFLAETKQMPWDAKLEEKNGKKVFVNPALEGKANWWKFCWRAGPEATNAAREFATQWLADLNAPPSKLSDDK